MSAVEDIRSFEATVTEKTLIASAKGLKSGSLKKKARYFAALKHIRDLAELMMDRYKPELIAAKVAEFFPDEDLKVVFQEGSKQSAIDAKALYDELKKRNRKKEFFEVATVTASALKSIQDGEELIEKFKYSLIDTTAPSIRVGPLSKEDKKFAAAGIIK